MTGNTGRLLRLVLRRDRFIVPLWVLGGVLLYWSQGVSVEALYPTQAEFDLAAETMADNAAFIAMTGPPRALNTVGGQVAWQSAAFGAVLAGLMSMLIVGRHTRAEEESGRAELIRAGAVGRRAPLVAVAVAVLLANVVFGGAITSALAAYGLPFPGSASLGLAATLAGLVFGAAALVSAQLTESTRAMYGLTGLAIGAAYVLRAVGDVGAGALSWLSPIGWGQAMRAFSGERWWPAGLSLGAVLVLTVAALLLLDRRDLGAGAWRTRSGPSRGGPGLRSSLGLAWRLQRASLYGWTAGMFVTGLAYGTIGDDAGDLVGDSDFSRDVFGSAGESLVDSFYAVSALTLALLAAGFAISSSLRARAEELAGRVAPLLASGVPRWRWATSHLALTGAGTVAVIGAAGLGLGLGYLSATDDVSAVPRLLGATTSYFAPVLVLVALTWLFYGMLPRWAPAIGWGSLTYCVVVMLFGTVLRFPDWVMKLSPFSHLALAPAQPFAWEPLLWLLVIAVLAGAVGIAALRHRDVG